MIVGALISGTLGIIVGALLGIVIIHILAKSKGTRETEGDFK